MAPGALAAAFPTCCSPSGVAAPRKSLWGWRGIPRGKHQGHVPRDACVKPPYPSQASSLRGRPGMAHRPEARPCFGDSSRAGSVHWPRIPWPKFIIFGPIYPSIPFP